MVAGRREALQDLSNHLLLQVRVAADAQAVRQRQHEALLHLHDSCCFGRHAPDLRFCLAYGLLSIDSSTVAPQQGQAWSLTSASDDSAWMACTRPKMTSWGMSTEAVTAPSQARSMQEAASRASFGSWEHRAARFRDDSSSPCAAASHSGCVELKGWKRSSGEKEIIVLSILPFESS